MCIVTRLNTNIKLKLYTYTPITRWLPVRYSRDKLQVSLPTLWRQIKRTCPIWLWDSPFHLSFHTIRLILVLRMSWKEGQIQDYISEGSYDRFKSWTTCMKKVAGLMPFFLWIVFSPPFPDFNSISLPRLFSSLFYFDG